MNPFFFGTSEERLLGVHHPPRGRAPRDVGVLLCAPFGQEYMRAHRAFRQLGLLLARRGFHVLRFDWFGTGDSAGDAEEGSLARWVADARAAIEELEDTAGVARVSLVGLRLGALVAALAAEGRDDVADLVLWDPVVEGRLYLEQLRKAQHVHAGEDPGDLTRLAPDAVAGILGFPITGALAAELTAADLTAVGLPALRRVLSVVAEEREEYARCDRALAERGLDVRSECLPAGGSWAEVDNFGSALIPHQIVQAIVAFLDQEPGGAPR